MGTENWDDDFEGELTIPNRRRSQGQQLQEHLSMVKQYALVTKHLIAQIPVESASDCLKSDAVTRAIELVAISQQDRQSPYFQRPIVKEYFGEEDSYRWLGSLANSDMDMDKLRDLKRQADQLVDQLEDKVDKVKV